MQSERRVAANPQTKPVDLGCESAKNWLLPSTCTNTIAIVIITQPISSYSFYHPTKGGRLSRPKHCSKGAQPVLKTVYRSSCRDKHNCQRRDSNLDPLSSRVVSASETWDGRPLRKSSIEKVDLNLKLYISYTAVCKFFLRIRLKALLK